MIDRIADTIVYAAALAYLAWLATQAVGGSGIG